MGRRFLSWLVAYPGKVADAILVPAGVIVVLVFLAVVEGLIFHSRVRLWIAIVAVALSLTAGLMVGTRIGRPARDELDQLEDLRRRTEELGDYETYAEHLRDALGDLRKAILGELPSFSLRDFIEIGVFQPAQRLLESGDRGEVRFSILHVQGDEFVMTGSDGLLPALGHRSKSREGFRLAVNDSFSQYAFRRNRIFWSSRLSQDERFERHALANSDRAYESIVSVPLRLEDGGPDGVLNAIATEPEAFSSVDRTYIGLLASVIDVGRAIVERDSAD